MHDYTIWRVVDSHWVNISREGTYGKLPYEGVLSMYLWLHRFDIPETIKYCLAENDKYRLKFRVHGGTIHVHISDNN